MISIKNSKFINRLRTESFQKILVAVVTFIVAYILIISGVGAFKNHTGATSNEKAKGLMGIISAVDSSFLEDAQKGEAEVITDIYGRFDSLFSSLNRARVIYQKDNSDLNFAVEEFMQNATVAGVELQRQDAQALIINRNEVDILNFRKLTWDIFSKIVKERNNDNAEELLNNIETEYRGKFIPEVMKRSGTMIIQSFTREVNDNLTIFTASQTRVLVNVGVMAILGILFVFIISYLRSFSKDILADKQKLLLLAMSVVITLIIARWVAPFSTIAIPIFIATTLVAIFIEPVLALIINVIITLVITLIIPVDIKFIVMSLIGGSYAAIFTAKANKKNRLFLSGIMIGVINLIIIASIGMIRNTDIKVIGWEALIAFLNGIFSIVISIGILPFFESIFNIVTPVKLLEIMNPNHPLIKRLLIEAPGTYHHSLMVGNLAESAAEAIGANALLARASAYYHDIGKLNRPDFFMENQMVDNPHERLTPNLSTLVITSHTNDGYDLAKKYKIPLAVRDIIREHHGTSLVAYFYHKAKSGEKGDLVTEDNFRYSGPKPSTVEAAVVMLADCVEAAVRALPDKTEGKIEGMIRKIVKGKLEDGQLEQCDLTLKDLDNISCAFIKVFSGYFHEREAYPQEKASSQKVQDANREGEDKDSASIDEKNTVAIANKDTDENLAQTG